MDRLQRYQALVRDWAPWKVINLNPIQRGGILSPEARKAIVEYADGYSVCDWCPPKTPRLDRIERPPIHDFYNDLATFLDADATRVVTRCREAKFISFLMLKRARGGRYVVVDGLAHYSTFLAAELCGLQVKTVPVGPEPEFRLDPEGYHTAIEAVRRESGELPTAVLLTHVDPTYGNLQPAREVAKIAHDYGIPFILNAAYTAGVMPVSLRDLGCDILTSSGHKSWAAPAPTGILALTEEMVRIVLQPSQHSPVKELALLGCTVPGAPLIGLMASFPHVVQRVQRWEEEVKKAEWLAQQLERIEGTRVLGQRPRQHHVLHVRSEGLHQIAKRHRKRGYFLYHELKKRGIVGIQPGLTRHFKLSTYGLSWEEVRKVATAFLEIAEQYGIRTT